MRLNVKHMCCSHQGVLVGPTCLTAEFHCSGHHTGRPPSRIWPSSAQQCLHSDANLRDHLVDALTEELEVLECTFERVAGHRSQPSWWTVGCSCPGRQTWQLAGTLDDPDSYGLLPTNLPRICVPLQMRIRIPQALQEHQPDGPVSTRNDGRAACLLQSSARTPRRARTPRLQCNSFQWCTTLQPGRPRARAPTTSAAWYKPQVAMCSLRHVQPTICTREKQSRGGTRAGLQCPPCSRPYRPSTISASDPSYFHPWKPDYDGSEADMVDGLRGLLQGGTAVQRAHANNSKASAIPQCIPAPEH